MKQSFLRRFALLCAVLLLASALASCGDHQPDPVVTTAAATSDETVPDETYEFPQKITLSDAELNIFNFDQYYNSIINIDVEEHTDIVSDKIWNRNRLFEEQYHIAIKEEKLSFTERKASFKEASERLGNIFRSGDDVYDVVYVSLFEQYNLVSSGYLKDLNDIPTLHLEAEWWDSQLSGSFILPDGKCYVAASPLNLMSYETTWLVFFNQQLARDRNMPDLFEIVGSGEWTIEKMLSLIEESGVITENAGGGYAFDENGSALYGIAVHDQGPAKFLTGFDISFIQPTEDNSFRFAVSSTDDFSRANNLLLRLYARDSGMAIGTDAETESPDGYVPIFQKGRSLFLHAELKSGMTMRRVLNSDVNYGLLPMPKLDREQSEYITTTVNEVMLFAIPETCRDADEVGLAGDVLSYLSFRDVLPDYYYTYIAYRNVGDVNSLSMLNTYIMPGRRLEVGVIYGWMNEFVADYNPLIYKGENSGTTTLGNILNTYGRTINNKINKFFEE